MALAAPLLFAAKTYAQSPLRFGLHFSPNIGWLKTDASGASRDGTVVNYSYGLITEFTIGNTDNYALSTGLSIFNQSAAYTNTILLDANTTATIEGKQKLQYIELPLALKLQSNEIGYLTYFGKFGLSNKFKIAADSEVSLNSGESQSASNQEGIQFYNASLLIGAGAEYNLSGNTSFLFGVDFHNGFTNLFNDDDSSPNFDAKTYNITLNVGVLF